MAIDIDAAKARAARASEAPVRTKVLERPEVPAPSVSLIVVVLRTINTAQGVMYGQRLRYADSPPVVGQYEAYGENLRLYPFETAEYGDYENWVWPEDPVTTATVPLLARCDRGNWIVMIPFKADASLLPADEPVSGCNFG